MNRFAQTLCAVTLLLLLAGCQSTANGVTSQVTPDNPQIFRVGHEVYTLNDFSKRMEQDIGPAIENLMSQGQTREQIEQLANDQQIRESVFESMVQEALLSQYARSQGIGVDAASVDSAVLAQAAPFDPASPFASLTTKRVSEAQTELVLAVLVKNTRADMFHARMIKLSSEADADQALADIKSGASFEALVAQRSKDPQSSEKKGDLGWIPLGNEPTELNSAGFSLALNTPSKVQVGDAWYVVEVLERQAGTTTAEKRPFDNLEQLQQSANAQQFYLETFVPWYDQLRKDAETSGDLEIAPNFDPNTVPLPFPKE